MICDHAPPWAVVDATWPPAAKHVLGPWTIRQGLGGGKRVSAASAEQSVGSDEIDAAQAAMKDLDQPALFAIRDRAQTSQQSLDDQLTARGYECVDPTNFYSAPVAVIATDRPPRVSMFSVWEPLEIQREIWASGGIGPARQIIMQRAQGPKTSLLMRWDDHPAGTGFVAIFGSVAMVHALEILPHQRRKGVARWAMRQAAVWAQSQGATTITVLCTQENTAANELYGSLGMQLVGQYHYRMKKELS